MKNVLLHRAIKLNRERKYKKGWQKVVSALCAVVVFCTTYALILPAITMEQEAACGFEAHGHGEACYEQQAVYDLQCSLTAQDCAVIHSHDAACYDAEGALRCTLAEVKEHAHSDACYEAGEITCQLPESEGHAHSEACAVTETVSVCTLEETEEHTHEEACFETRTVPCELEESEGHVHTEDCAGEPVLTCQKEELQAHTHEDACYDAEGTLVCQLPQAVVHIHGESCLAATEETVAVLTCQLPEHIHEDACYPLEEEESVPEYLCGSGEHIHAEGCADEEGTLTCTIPEHTHEAACLVEDLDLNADVEVASQWEAALAELQLTGNWSEDVLIIAQSQLGYRESSKNCVLVSGELKGYTRYGAWYGDPYGDWDATFVSFCLNYAGVEDFPRNCDSSLWITALQGTGAYVTPDAYTAKPGDLIFFDYDQKKDAPEAVPVDADKVGIVAEVLASEIRVIEGNAANKVAYVTYKLDDPAIIGYGAVPQNPMSEEDWNQAKAVSDMIDALPAAEEAAEKLAGFNEIGSRIGYDAYLQELASQIQAAYEAYEALYGRQKEQIQNLSRLTELEQLCSETVWQELPAVTDDTAIVSGLAVADMNAETADGEQRTAGNEETVGFGFSVTTESYSGEVYFEGRVKLEFVLPLTEEQAVFDTAAMSWLDSTGDFAPVVTTEDRIIDGKEISCQVLTGYKLLQPGEAGGSVVPGTFTETLAVKVLDMEHGEQITVLISAAMEHGTWDGLCEIHGLEEKLTIVTDTVTVQDPLPPEEQQAVYEAFLTEIEELVSQELDTEELRLQAEALLERINVSYNKGELADAQYEELAKQAEDLIFSCLGDISEPAIGTNWEELRDSGWFEEYAGITSSYSQSAAANLGELMLPQATDSIAAFAARTTSASQIDREGGENYVENAVYVSKTIAGTELENVFDITLQIITQDEIHEVYQEPDMAVVIVMDISNTMNSNFGSTTRYKAAMEAAENFLDEFTASTNGKAISQVGFVAFNTSAHQIFELSYCQNEAQATALKNTMRTATGNIINATNYSTSRSRFTNVEAGLKMGWDMLAQADNANKYIIFLSDGFPTTYISSGYTGYDPYCSSGWPGVDGVFYDSVMGVHCDYGTSYSDKAAIRARQMAARMKAAGVNIFSIGVDVGGQTIQKYVSQSENVLKTYSVVDRTGTTYEIGDATSAEAYKNWLRNSIGSGYYYDSTDSAGLTAAFTNIFATIKQMNAASAHLDWVATDPMPGMGVHELETIEFIAFYDIYGNLQDQLTGVSADGPEYENTASFNPETQTITWDLKQSGYISITMDNVTNYMCTLSYRVRLKNEETGFQELAIYDTNDTTSLTYRVIEVTNGQASVSDRETIYFPIPAVHGYLAELNFMKVDSVSAPVAGAEFTLSHDTVNCGACRGDGTSSVPVPDYVQVSGDDGMVSFTQIPSGHHYVLTETKVPEGYKAKDHTYHVVVSYDALTVTVTDAEGNTLEWSETIENDTFYVLPATGGMGTSHFTFGGLLIIAVGLVYICIIGRKRRKGGG